MPDLTFSNVPGSWHGNDYKRVSMTSVKAGSGPVVALIYMTHMNLDFDGAPNAYGPPEKQPLDCLANAGQHDDNGYYGVMSVNPHATVHGIKPPVLVKNYYHLKLDERFPDRFGRCPVVQQTGTYAGYYVSTTASSTGSRTIYDQEHYHDSLNIPFCALSYNLSTKGVGDQDFGIAIRHDSYRQASFHFMAGEGHAAGTPGAGAVGECSYKVFLDIGGADTARCGVYANNNFSTTFVVFPGSRDSRLRELSAADNSEDLAVFLALQAEVDARSRGDSGVPAFKKYLAGGRTTKPRAYDNVVGALRAWGYIPGGGAAARKLASDLKDAINQGASSLAADIASVLP